VPFDPLLIDVPQLLDARQLESVASAFREAGIAFSSEAVSVGVDIGHQNLKFALHVRRDQSEPATRILASVLELEDPDDDRPFTGECPGCGAAVRNAWSCPSCELGFRSRFERDDPMIVFVREHRGFREH
jgi:hypothetical protein